MMRILFTKVFIMLGFLCQNRAQELNVGIGVNLMQKMNTLDYPLNFGYQNRLLSYDANYANRIYGMSPYVVFYTKKYWKFSASGSAKYLHYFDGYALDLTVGKGTTRALILEGGLSLFKGRYDDGFARSIIGSYNINQGRYSRSQAIDTIPPSYKVSNILIPYFKFGMSINVKRFTLGWNWLVSMKKLYGYTLEYGTKDYERENFNHFNLYARYNLLSHQFSKNQSVQKNKINQVVQHWRWSFSVGVELNRHSFDTPIKSFYFNRDDLPYGEYTHYNMIYNGYTYDYEMMIRSSPVFKFGVDYALSKRLKIFVEFGLGTIAYRQKGIVVDASEGDYLYFDDTSMKANLFWQLSDDFSGNPWIRMNWDISYAFYQRLFSLESFMGLTFNRIKYHWSVPGYALGSNTGFQYGLKLNVRKVEIKLFSEKYFGLKGGEGDKIRYTMNGVSIGVNFLQLNNFKNSVLR